MDAISGSGYATLFEVTVPSDPSHRRGSRSSRVSRFFVVGSGLTCTVALLLLALPFSRRGTHSELENVSAMQLVGKNEFKLDLPPTGSGGDSMPSWDQIKKGGLGLATGSSSAYTTQTNSHSSSSASYSFGGDDARSNMYNNFLSALQPSDANPDSTASSDGSADDVNDTEPGGSEDSDDGGDSERQAQDYSEGQGQDREATHRSAEVVVHRLADKFDARFSGGEDAYDFCLRDRLTHEELAECIKHMLMKASPEYRPSDNQDLLDRISVLRLQIKEQETQSARAIRKLHLRVQELKTRLLTAVPYSEFKALRDEYENKLRVLQRLVIRFTHDMATRASRRDNNNNNNDDDEDNDNDFEGFQHGTEAERALWRLLRMHRRSGESFKSSPTDTSQGGTPECDSCRKPKVKIPHLLPFKERREYMERQRTSGGGGGGRAEPLRTEQARDYEQSRDTGRTPRKDPRAVAVSASQSMHAAMDAVHSKGDVRELPALPTLQPLHLPDSLKSS